MKSETSQTNLNPTFRMTDTNKHKFQWKIQTLDNAGPMPKQAEEKKSDEDEDEGTQSQNNEAASSNEDALEAAPNPEERSPQSPSQQILKLDAKG